MSAPRIPRTLTATSLAALLSVVMVTGAQAEWNATGVTTFPSSLASYDCVVPDGAGGVFVFADDNGVIGQRFDGHGNRVWSTDLTVSSATANSGFIRGVPDGAGGIIIVFPTGEAYTLRAQRIGADGTLPWAAGGVAIGTPVYSYSTAQVCGDGSDGALVFWRTSYDSLAVQHVDGSGTPLLGPSGRVIVQVPAAFDASGDALGAVIAVTRRPTSYTDVFVQRVDLSGTPLWSLDGLPVCTAASFQNNPVVVSNDAGDAILAWNDSRAGGTDPDLYAQRVDVSGTPQWTADGILVNNTGAHLRLHAIRDGSDGSILAWQTDNYGNSVVTQRVDAGGNVLWSPGGVVAINLTIPIPYSFDGWGILGDGQGGAMVVARQNSTVVSTGHVWSNGTIATPQAIVTPAAGPDLAVVQVAADRGAVLSTGIVYDGKLQRFDLTFGFFGEPEPTGVVVADVPNDQGGNVLVQWHGSQQDVAPRNTVTGYSIWRSEAGMNSWTMVAEQAARYSPQYAMVAPTGADGTTYDWKVRTVTTSYFYWDSEVASGASEDNLSPAPPVGVMARRTDAGVSLSWSPADADAREFVVYRSATSGVTATPASRIGSVTLPSFTDADAPRDAAYYAVAAVDASGNISRLSEETLAPAVAGGGSTPQLSRLVLRTNSPNPFSDYTTLHVGLPAAGAIIIDVYDVAGRRVSSHRVATLAAGWNDLTLGARRDDGGALASGVYLYRVRTATESVTGKLVIHRP